MRSCQQLEDFILDYLDGDLPPRQQIVFKLHLKLCRECRAYLAAYRQTIDVTKLVARSGGPRHPETMPDDLIKAIREARKA